MPTYAQVSGSIHGIRIPAEAQNRSASIGAMLLRSGRSVVDQRSPRPMVAWGGVGAGPCGGALCWYFPCWSVVGVGLGRAEALRQGSGAPLGSDHHASWHVRARTREYREKEEEGKRGKTR